MSKKPDESDNELNDPELNHLLRTPSVAHNREPNPKTMTETQKNEELQKFCKDKDVETFPFCKQYKSTGGKKSKRTRKRVRKTKKTKNKKTKRRARRTRKRS